jgi:succinoglycan biosynthesis transport protein ExoP
MDSDRNMTAEMQWGDQPRLSRMRKAETQYDFVDLWKVIRRRGRILIGVTLALTLLGLLYSFVTPRLYKSEAKLEILKQDAASEFGDPAEASNSAAADALDFNLAEQTEVDVLESRNMALRVVHELHLDSTRDYQLADDSAESGRALEQSPRRLAHVLEKFDKRLHVSAVSGTRLISVSFLDRDPERAAQVVNQLLADFIEYNYQVRFTASSQATSFLSGELQQMKAQVDVAQANVVKLQQQSGIYGVDETNNAVNARLEQLNAQLTAAQANLVLKRSVYELAITRSPEVLAGMIGAQGTGANTVNAPLQLLRQQQAEAAATFAELNAHYGPEYPKVVQAGQRLESIQQSTHNEIERLVGQATAEYKVAADTEAAAARALHEQEAVASQMNHDAILYTSAKHEADSSRDLYEQLLRRLKEAGVLAGMHSTNLNILDPAVPADKPAQPMTILYTLVGSLVGLMMGIFAAFTAEAMDNTVREPQKIEDAMGVPVLALIPPVDRSMPKIALQSLRRGSAGPEWQYQMTARSPRSTVAETFRVLRTAILTGMPAQQSRVLGVTSTSEGEGKSFTTFNLAAAFAQSGRSVVVVDADLRKRTLTKALGFDRLNGLAEAVSELNWQKYITAYEETPGLYVLPAGQPGYFPADILGSVMMGSLLANLRSRFSVVLIDTPSILPVTDTVSLSSLVDALMIVAKCGHTAQHSLVRTRSVLQRSGARVLGVVLNGMDFNSSDFYYYWGKQSKGYEASTGQILTRPRQVVGSPARIVATLLCVLALGSASRAAAQTTSPRKIGTTTTANANAGRLVIGSGDLLSVSVYDAPELAQDVRVGSDGNIHLQLLGDMAAVGLQPSGLAKSIEQEYRVHKFISSPQVSVVIKEFTSQGVTVEGEVKKPGVFPIYSDRSLVDVLALAEGTTPSADTRISIRRHGSGEVERVTLVQNSGEQNAENDVRVYPGDTVIVPRAGLAYVLGDVGRPGGYIMHDNGSMTILQAISEAQGTTRNASLKHVVLLRKSGSDTETIPIQLKEMMRGKAKDRALLNGDILFVPPSGLKNFAQSTESLTASMAGAALYVVAN